jgi:serine/threonine protein kinase
MIVWRGATGVPPMPLDLQPGDVYAGTIRIHGVLGVGSFARVYEVEAPGYPERLALKLTREPVRSGEQAQRALREITILRSLTNPHVVRTFDCGLRPDGHIYLLMDLLAGQTLDQWHDFRAPLDAAQAVTVIHQACLGLAEAHAMGVVHRDVKPENIFIERGGRVKMLDFGLARSWDGRPVVGIDATEAHLVVGTPHYSQPEQLKTRVLTPASDVYSLATILYELLSGHAALFAHQTVSEVIEALHDNPLAWLDAHATREVVPITRYPGCAGLPDSLLQLLDRALDKDPLRRPQLAGQLASALGDILHDDLGATAAAEVAVRQGGSWRSVPLVPGRRRVGAGEICAVQVTGRDLLDVHAHIDWSGSPRLAQIRPAAPGAPITIDGLTVDRVATLRPDADVLVGPIPLRIHYPEPTGG